MITFSLQDIDLAPNHEENERGIFWNVVFLNMFNEKLYVSVFSKQSNGLYLTVWAKKDVMNHIGDIKSGKLIKKELLLSRTTCQGVRFRIFEKSCFFLNISLLGTIPKYRIQETKEILENFSFGDDIKISNHENLMFQLHFKIRISNYSYQ